MLSGLLQLYFWIIIAATIMTWISPDPYNPIVRAIYGITEPVFDWVREHMPVLFGGIDFSPMVVIIVILFLQQWAIPHLSLALAYGFV